MKTVLLCYFSGTGNTAKVVGCYAACLEKLGYKVTLKNIENGSADEETASFDLLGIAYPVHAFNAPSNVLEFAKSIKKLPKNEKRPFFIVKTSGEPLKINNISSLKLKSIMKKRGFTLTNEYHYCMPYNIIFRHSDNMAFKMWDTAQKVIPVDCKELSEGKTSELKRVPFGSFLARIFRIEHWGGRFNGKRYKVSDKCIKCGLCEKNCPEHNISTENGKLKFGKNCLMCMRCSFNCPENAIKIGLFDKWKVNGAYNFDNYNENEVQTHTKYCRKSYRKYFERSQKRVNDNS